MKLTDAKKLGLLMEELKNLNLILKNLKKLKMQGKWYASLKSFGDYADTSVSTESVQTGEPVLAKSSFKFRKNGRIRLMVGGELIRCTPVPTDRKTLYV